MFYNDPRGFSPLKIKDVSHIADLIGRSPSDLTPTRKGQQHQKYKKLKSQRNVGKDLKSSIVKDESQGQRGNIISFGKTPGRGKKLKRNVSVSPKPNRKIKQASTYSTLGNEPDVTMPTDNYSSRKVTQTAIQDVDETYNDRIDDSRE